MASQYFSARWATRSDILPKRCSNSTIEIISKVTESFRMLETSVRLKGVHPHADKISFNLLGFISKLK